MPYQYRTDTRARLWIPEKDLQRWETRGLGLDYRQAWLREDGPAQEELSSLSELPRDSRPSYLLALGADIGSAQRDGFVYANQLEQLKNARPTLGDGTADEVVDRMLAWGFASASWLPEEGGPPPHKSPRPWRRTLDWLLKLIKDVGRFLVNSAKSFVALVQDLNIKATAKLSSVGIQVGFPPSFTLEFEPDVFKDTMAWGHLNRFLDAIFSEQGLPYFDVPGPGMVPLAPR